MARNFVVERYQNLTPAFMNTVDVLANKYDDLINLSLGDPDIITPDLIIEKAFEDAKAGHTKYTQFRGDPELREEIAKYYQEDFGIKVEDEEIIVCASATVAMFAAMEAVLEPGDEIIIQGPYFSPYTDQVRMTGAVPVELMSYLDEDFQVMPERLESLITDKTKAIVVNSPNNPTGSALTKETMKKIVDIAIEHDLLLISDEIYTTFSYESEFIPFLSFPEIKDRLITINTFSKNFLMTGWRVGNIIAPKEMMAALTHVIISSTFTTCSISQRAAVHALRNRAELNPPIVEEFRKRMYYGAERINKIPKMHVQYPPRGTFYLFPEISETGMDSTELTLKILEEAHILVIPGSGFGHSGDNHIRLCCTLPVEKLGEAFDRIEKMDIFQK